MRRLAPWALLGLLTVGTAAGIALGVANQPGPTPAQWVTNALATTANAGTARLTVHVVTSNSNGAGSDDDVESITTSGLLDFTHDAIKETTVFRPTVDQTGPNRPDLLLPSDERTEEIAIGRAYYMGISFGTQVRWITETAPRSVLGILNAQGISSLAVVESGLNDVSPAIAVRNLGAATIGNETTTKYAVSVGPPQVCSGASSAAWRIFDESPRTVWIDRAGRIVQEQSVVREPVSQSTSGGRQSEEGTTTVTTLRLSEFGAPVSIAAPRVRARHIGTVIQPTNSAKASSCPAGASVLTVVPDNA